MEERRAALVAELEERGIPLAEPVRRALLSVPRHGFVPGVFLVAVFRVTLIGTRRDRIGDPISGSGQPSVLAAMFSPLDLQAGQRVLEIGAGTGYSAALLAEIVGAGGHVTAVEIDDEIADAAAAHLDRSGYGRVQIVHGDGAAGVAENAPYDRIVAAAAVWGLPPAWLEQLRPDGLLAVAFMFGGIQVGAVLAPQPDGSLRSRAVFPGTLVRLRGEAAGPERTIRLPGSSLRIRLQEGCILDEAGVHTLLSGDQDVAQLPVELDRRNLGLFSYHLLFHQPPAYHLATYQVEEGQIAYGLTGIGWGILSSTTACLVPFGDQRVVHIYGGVDSYLELVRLSQEWGESGQPGLERAHLVITPAGRPPFQPPEGAVQRLFSRSAFTYCLWIDPPDEPGASADPA